MGDETPGPKPKRLKLPIGDWKEALRRVLASGVDSSEGESDEEREDAEGGRADE